jgi:threonylcarbamoyladenosine tRNA methylthiotransferase MtaB
VPKLKAAVHVLGCKVNQTEAEAIVDLFLEAGYEIVDFPKKSDVYVIHTCTVTKESDRKSKQAIRRAVRANPKAVVVVSGCFAQIKSGELADVDGVDLIIGTSRRNRIVEYVEKVKKMGKTLSLVQDTKSITDFEDLPFRPGRTRAFFKIQEGCQQYCSYCIVPYARGPVRSRPIEDALEKMQALIQQGYQEIVLTGIRLGAYGSDLKPTLTLAELIRKACQLPGLNRLRISSVDPNDFSKELIEVLTGEEVICPHYHIPLQSGDDFILKRMGRRYTTEEYKELIYQLHSRRPEASITTDVMVGFPGEKEVHFNNTKNFLGTIGFMDVHVFKYSPREGTPAASYSDQIAGDIKKKSQ